MQRFGCTSCRRCIKCDNRNTCTRGEAKAYRIYKKKRNSILKLKYFCDYVQGKCKLKKCKHYNSCTKNAKKNFEVWMKAYLKDNQEELEKMMRGSV